MPVDNMTSDTYPMPFMVQQLYRCATCKKFASRKYVETGGLCQHCDGKFEVIPGKPTSKKKRGMGIFAIYDDQSFISKTLLKDTNGN